MQFHVDGVNYARPSAARVAFFDLEGLQVLRGPQGTRGGKNSTAGWISLHTRKPSADFGIEGDFQWGSYDQRRTRAAINLPINEYVQTRFATYRREPRRLLAQPVLQRRRSGRLRRRRFRLPQSPAIVANATTWMCSSATTTTRQRASGRWKRSSAWSRTRRCNPIPPPFIGTGYNPTDALSLLCRLRRQSQTHDPAPIRRELPGGELYPRSGVRGHGL